MIFFITGGERSGKSRYAQQIALQHDDHPTYLATARKWDSDFEKRIARHQAERDERWINLEEEKYISAVPAESRIVVLDCITLWLTNIFIDTKNNADDALAVAKAELEKAFQKPCSWIIISNEIGMGVHAATEAGRRFVELQGWVNQFLSQKADVVYLMVSGIPVKIKPGSSI